MTKAGTVHFMAGAQGAFNSSITPLQAFAWQNPGGVVPAAVGAINVLAPDLPFSSGMSFHTCRVYDAAPQT